MRLFDCENIIKGTWITITFPFIKVASLLGKHEEDATIFTIKHNGSNDSLKRVIEGSCGLWRRPRGNIPANHRHRVLCSFPPQTVGWLGKAIRSCASENDFY